MKTLIKHSVFAGILIGLGATGFLALGGIPGAVIFAFGLVGVVLTNTPLYTGKAGVINSIKDLVIIWFFNILACTVIGLLVNYLGGDSVERAKEIAAARIDQEPLKVLIRAIGCGLIIDISCYTFRQTGRIIPVLFGVPLFILCGFYHSIADVVYLFAAGEWSNAYLWYYPVIVLGNYAGCNVRRLIDII